MRVRPQKPALVAAPFEHKPTRGVLHYQTGRKPAATDYVWEGMFLEDRQGERNPNVDKLQRYNVARN